MTFALITNKIIIAFARPFFELMIACDTKHCDIEWYHCPYVNIKIAAKES